MNAIHYKATLEHMLGVKLKRCRIGAGSMRQYIKISIAAPFAFTGEHSADNRARHEWIAERVGFAPFYTSREYMSTGDFCACLSSGAIKMPAENYAEVLA